MGQCSCLDREREKNRIVQQLTFTSPMPKRLPNSRESNLYMQPSLSTNSRRVEQFPSQTLQKITQFSTMSAHRSVRSDTASYSRHQANNQFILINKAELAQFVKTNQAKIEQILQNPINRQQFIICFDQYDSIDPYIYEIVLRETTYNKLYIAIKDFIASPEKKIVGLVPESDNALRVYFRKLNQRQAQNNAIEMQMVETVNSQILEEIVNERVQDNLICFNLLQLQNQNILFFQMTKKPIQTLNVIQLDLRTLNHINLSQEIAGKVEILQSNDEFEFISLLPDVITNSLFILMSIKQI